MPRVPGGGRVYINIQYRSGRNGTGQYARDVCQHKGKAMCNRMNRKQMTNSATLQVSRDDGLPSTICNNCMYRLGVAFHLKQQCENSDMRLRQYMNGCSAMSYSYTLDKETMTDDSWLLSGMDHKGDDQKSPEKCASSEYFSHPLK